MADLTVPTADPTTLANLRAIAEERERQRVKWGDAHDDEMGREHLLDIICDRASELFNGEHETSDLEEATVLGALCLAFADRCVRDATGVAGEGKETD